MTNDHFSALLQIAGAIQDGNTWALEDERTITLHAAFQGVPLNLSKIKKVRLEDGLLYAEATRGDVTIVSIEDVYAGAVDGPSKATRAAGFR